MCDLGPGMSYIFTKEWHEAIKVDVAKAEELRTRAAMIAAKNCHTMGDWMQINGSWVSWCRRCKRQAKATSRPFFKGEKELEGRALAELCTLKRLTKGEREKAWQRMRQRKIAIFKAIHGLGGQTNENARRNL